MDTVAPSFHQILETVKQLPAGQRQKLVDEIQNLPPSRPSPATIRRVRAALRMGPKKRKRMSILLQKGNAGTLSVLEKKELNQLVEEFEQKTLEMAQELTAPLTDRILHEPTTVPLPDGKAWFHSAAPPPGRFSARPIPL